MIFVRRNTCFLLCAMAVVVPLNTVKSHPTLADINLHFDINTNEENEVETFTIQQHTPLSRRRRDAGDQVIGDFVDFPSSMEYTFNFKAGDVNLRLKRNEYMTSAVTLSDENGPLTHTIGDKLGIYKDLDNRASFVIQCEDDQGRCTLRGSLDREGRSWDISPDLEKPDSHIAVQTKQDSSSPTGSDALTVPDDAGDSDDDDEQTGDIPRSGRQKRDIPTNCSIVECLAIVDESVWAFFLAKTGNNDTAAEEQMLAQYLTLYAQADLHYDFVSERRTGACLRLYLAGVHIQKTTAESWSSKHELIFGVAVLAFVNAPPSITECGTQCTALRSTNSMDLCQCFTRKDIVYNTDGTMYDAYHRGLAFQNTVCNPEKSLYNSQIIESYGDKVELLIAKLIAVAIGTDDDSKTGCQDTDQYIMSERVAISEDVLKTRNIWYFSTCSVDEIFEYLNTVPPCLQTNAFNVTQYDAFKNQQLGGQIYSWQDQCELRFGVESLKCDPTGQNRTFFPDMCNNGIYCTNVAGACEARGRPYEGTPCGEDFDAYCLKGDCYIPPRPLGSVCGCHADCADSNATCSESLICECRTGYYNNTGTCQPKVTVGSSCPVSAACLDLNAECESGVCTCKSGYYNESDSCILLKYAGDNCTLSNECKGTNTECSGSPSTCRCPADHYLDVTTGNCMPKVTVGSSCPVSAACLDLNAECESGVCTCKSGYYNESDLCILLKYAGDNCTLSNECKGNNSECSGSPSTCRCPADHYLDFTTGNCMPKVFVNETCERGWCESDFAVCSPTTNTCTCFEGYLRNNTECNLEQARSGAVCLESANQASITTCDTTVAFAVISGATDWCVNNCRLGSCPVANCVTCYC